MKEYRGVVELGDSRIVTGKRPIYIYSYIQVGDVGAGSASSMIKQVGVCSGLNGKLQLAVESGCEIALYVQKDYLIGITVNGKTYATDFGGSGFIMSIIALFCLFTTPFMGFGILVWSLVYFTYWRTYTFTKAAKKLPNVILI